MTAVDVRAAEAVTVADVLADTFEWQQFLGLHQTSRSSEGGSPVLFLRERKKAAAVGFLLLLPFTFIRPAGTLQQGSVSCFGESTSPCACQQNLLQDVARETAGNPGFSVEIQPTTCEGR